MYGNAILREFKKSNLPNHMRPADGGAFISPSSSSAQRLLPTTIFPSAKTMHHTSVCMRFMRTPIACRCAGERPLNRRASVENSALHQATRMSIGRHCARRRPHDLRNWGYRFHVRSSFNSGLKWDIPTCRKSAKIRLMHRSKMLFVKLRQHPHSWHPPIGSRAGHGIDSHLDPILTSDLCPGPGIGLQGESLRRRTVQFYTHLGL
jgi:hypothetical protein